MAKRQRLTAAQRAEKRKIKDARRAEKIAAKQTVGSKVGPSAQPKTLPLGPQPAPAPQVIDKAKSASFNQRYTPRSNPKPFIHVDKPFNWKLAKLWARIARMIQIGKLLQNWVWLRRVMFILQTHQMFGGRLAA